MPKTYIALDLETTGLEPGRDAIIEIGAVRFHVDGSVERFQTFVNPGRPIPPFITKLTGICDADVAGAPSPRQAAEQVAQFVKRDPVVGHNVGFDLAFLRRQRVLRANPGIDTFELAGILVPHASRYSLANLVEELGLNLPEQTHRALDDAELTRELFLALLGRAMQLPLDTLQELVRQGRRVSWGATYFFEDALHERRREGFQGAIGAQLAARRGDDAAGPLFVRESPPEPLQGRREPRPVDIEALTALLAPDGPIAEATPAYEYRSQQVEMMQAVAEAFNEGRHLLVEAGTGTGKSLAYLLPAIEWAVQNGQRVVISTNTINLQEQLAGKDIPQLMEALYPFRWQVMKGRGHYLCRRQFEAFRRRGPRSVEEARMLAKILIWLPNTLDGDGDELFLPTSEERQMWHDLSAGSEACEPERCRYFYEGTCFFYRARALAEAAHLLIVNHALLMADAVTQNRVLPNYELLIVDEAHHLERATTESLRYYVSWSSLSYTFGRLVGRGRRRGGLLAQIAEGTRGLPQHEAVQIREAVLRISDAVGNCESLLEAVFGELEAVLRERVGMSRDGYGTRLRVSDEVRALPAWQSVQAIWTQARPYYDLVLQALSQIVDGLADVVDVGLPELEEARAELLAVNRVLVEAREQIGRFIGAPESNIIYWLEIDSRGAFSLNVVPLHVGPLVSQYILETKRSVVLTSATLRVEGSFDYIRERLGIGDEARELALGSPFDYPSVALLYLVSDMPEPRTEGYQRTVESTLIDLFKATEGRALALFTSYSQLRATAQAITEPLSEAGITVLTQGSGSSRTQLLRNFQTLDRAVLLGTRSFWEGVDVPGEALSCLVIVKLPFDVPDDPIIAARSEMYGDSFNAYMVPEAILRFLQGFGRLIRTASDQGIVVVLDRRVLSRGYGRRFLASLPDPRVLYGTREELPRVAKRWLDGRPLPAGDVVSLEEGETWSDTSGDADEEPSWFWGA